MLLSVEDGAHPQRGKYTQLGQVAPRITSIGSDGTPSACPDRIEGCDSRVVDPFPDLVGVEPEVPPPLDERDPPLGNEASDVSHVHPEDSGDSLDVEQFR